MNSFKEAYEKIYHVQCYLQSKPVEEQIKDEYIAFSQYFQNLCIHHDRRLIDMDDDHRWKNINHLRNINLSMLYRLEAKRKKHPILWRIARWILNVG